MTVGAQGPRWLAAAALVATSAGLLVAVGQPIFTDDLWIHLALGDAYIADGLRLATDPHLYTAPAPLAPSSWLADVALRQWLAWTGFDGLRVLHVLGVAAILALAFAAQRRASHSWVFASAATVAFVLLADYRLVQLRPHLFTIAATLVTHRLLLERAAPPDFVRIGLASALALVWVNVHAGFVLGPVLVAGSAGFLLLAAPLRSPDDRAPDRTRALRLAIAAACMGVATLANPDGPSAFAAYFTSGGDTLDLGIAGDEWRAFRPFAPPPVGAPPAPLTWGLLWMLLVAVPIASVRAVQSWKTKTPIDPVRVALAIAFLFALFTAVRFTWLGVFALALLGSFLRGGASLPLRAALAMGALAGAAGFYFAGTWPMVTRALQSPTASYRSAYQVAKYHGHAIWMLRDAGVEGHLLNPYWMGGFASFWLSPAMQMSASGTMNVEPEAMQAQLAVFDRRGLDDRSFETLLDGLDVDVFLATGLPRTRRSNPTNRYTLAHLDVVDGWTPVFRSLRSAVHLRDHPRNDANFERIAAWYARQGVPFDRESGFDVERVVSEAPAWAIEHGLIPQDWRGLMQAVRRGSASDPGTAQALDRAATLYATLGLYENAERVDAALLRAQPANAAARRRRIWSLLHLGRWDEAAESAREAKTTAANDTLSDYVTSTALRIADDPAHPDVATWIAQLPLYGPRGVGTVMAGHRHPDVRPAP